MARQTEDVICALQVLEPDIEQVHQYDLSSGHKKAKEGGLAISSMNFNYGGKGGLALQDSDLGENSVGNEDQPAVMYELLLEGKQPVWSLAKPPDQEGIVVKEHDCSVRVGATQSMSFANADTHPAPPFYALKAPFSTVPDVDPISGQQRTI